MKAVVSLALLLCTLFLPSYAGAADLSPEEAVNTFLKALDKEKAASFLAPETLQPHALLQPSLTQSQGLNIALYPIPTGLSLLHPRTLARSDDTVNSYLFFTTGGQQSTSTYVGYARINKVEITELKRISDNEYKAEFMLGYTVGPFGSLLFGKSVQFQRPQDALLDSRDDGWRIKFIKTF